MIYDIGLTIESQYATATDHARNVIRLLPLTIPDQQRLVTGAVTIAPVPDLRLDRVDFFGNTVTEVAFRRPVDAISVSLQARVERLTAVGSLDLSPPLSGLVQQVAACQTLDAHSPLHFRDASARVGLHADMTAFARDCVEGAMTVAQVVRALGGRLHAEMRFEAGVTDVDTAPEVAFAARHGVCQDFSHVMIACLRGIGVPAGYVSGFLRTLPPEGQPRLEGADAMHAWVRAWCGDQAGWIEFDPTNDQFVGADHVVVGYGRDYADVAPIRGVLRTGGAQTSRHLVDVIPV